MINVIEMRLFADDFFCLNFKRKVIYHFRHNQRLFDLVKRIYIYFYFCSSYLSMDILTIRIPKIMLF